MISTIIHDQVGLERRWRGRERRWLLNIVQHARNDGIKLLLASLHATNHHFAIKSVVSNNMRQLSSDAVADARWKFGQCGPVFCAR